MASEAMDILGEAALKKKDVPKKAPKVKRKRPDGMSMELYGLLNNSSQEIVFSDINQN